MRLLDRTPRSRLPLVIPRLAPLWTPPRNLFVFPVSHWSSSVTTVDPVLVQSTYNGQTGASGATITFSPAWPGATTTGNLLVACVSVLSAGPAGVPTITPAANWVQAVTQTIDLGIGGTRGRNSIYYIANAASQSGTVTFTSSGGYMGTCRAVMVLMEYSGITTSSPLDQTAGASAATSSDTTVNSGTTGTTSQARELLIVNFWAGAALSSLTANYTAQQTNNAGICYNVVADRIVTSTGTYSASMTHSAAVNVGTIASFKIAN